MICGVCKKEKGLRTVCKTCYQKKYRSRPEVKERGRARRYERWGREFGFTPELEAKLKICQNLKCAICTSILGPQGRGMTNMHRDHDHNTGGARGLLCGACNHSLGYYEKRQRPSGLMIEPYDYYLSNTPVSKLILK